MIDLARFDELKTEVGSEDLPEILALFCAEVDETISRLHGSSPQSLLSDLHFIRGSALNIGMQTLADLCARKENALRRGLPLDTNFSEFRSAFDLSRTALEALVNPK